MQVLKFICIGLVIIVVMFAIAGLFIVDNASNKRCERIAQIARNGDAVAYLDKWVKDNIIDKGYYLTGGMHGSIFAVPVDGKTVYLELPKEKSSLLKINYLRFGVKKIGGEFEDPITAYNIGEIRFGQGRNSIIFLKNGQTMETHRGYDVQSGHLLKINNSLFAFCANSTF